MKLSNTMLISKDLLPNYNKAFTLAEVLITLTILGVVAAITIPTLINRQNEVAAKTKVKKAIRDFEQVATSYMAENSVQNIDAVTNSSTYTNYFKVASGSVTSFKTSDGVYWALEGTGDNATAVACDSATPKFCVKMGIYKAADAQGGNVDLSYGNAASVTVTANPVACSGACWATTAKKFMEAY